MLLVEAPSCLIGQGVVADSALLTERGLHPTAMLGPFGSWPRPRNSATCCSGAGPDRRESEAELPISK